MNPFQWWLRNVLFWVSGWMGYAFVWGITLGRVRLPHPLGSDASITQWIGVGVIVGLAYLVACLLPEPPLPPGPVTPADGP